MNLKNCVVSAAVLLLAFSSCKKNSNGKPEIAVKVYVAGFTTVNNNQVATYWKNGVATTLANVNKKSALNSIAVQNEDVYMAGYYTSSNGKLVAAYWKDNKVVALTDSTADCTANSIILSGSDIYVAGSFNGTAAYWKNRELTILTDYGDGSVANGIALQGGNIYVVGSLTNPFGLFFASFWLNGELGLFHPTDVVSSVANAIIVDNTGGMNVPGASYAPFVEGVSNIFTATYWSDGNVTALGDKITYSDANGIAFNGSDAYISGNTRASNGAPIATYWKNGSKNTLSDGSSYSDAYGIAIDQNDIYVAGDDFGGNATYWKNGRAIKLSSTFSSGRAIAIIE